MAFVCRTCSRSTIVPVPACFLNRRSCRSLSNSSASIVDGWRASTSTAASSSSSSTASSVDDSRAMEASSRPSTSISTSSSDVSSSECHSASSNPPFSNAPQSASSSIRFCASSRGSPRLAISSCNAGAASICTSADATRANGRSVPILADAAAARSVTDAILGVDNNCPRASLPAIESITNWSLLSTTTESAFARWARKSSLVFAHSRTNSAASRRSTSSGDAPSSRLRVFPCDCIFLTRARRAPQALRHAPY